MKIYESVSEWLKENPTKDKDPKVLAVLNKQDKRTLKAEIAKKEKEMEQLKNDLDVMKGMMGEEKPKNKKK